jgi:hypothetical protein
MRLVVTDACIFIDVIELQLTSKFFGLEFEVHTTIDVINELYPNQQEILRAFEQAGKLTIHILSAEEQIEIAKQNFPRSLSPEDASVIFTAQRLNATILSSDKPVRTFSKKLAIEYHGMLWIFDQLLAQKLISNTEAISKLQSLLNSNLIYKTNQDMITEIEKRITLWK